MLVVITTMIINNVTNDRSCLSVCLFVSKSCDVNSLDVDTGKLRLSPATEQFLLDADPEA